MAFPLSQLTSPALSFCWIPKAGAAFAELNKCFSSASWCNLIQPGIIVEVDASNSGVGEILSQWSGPNQKLHPYVFFPDSLTTTEYNFAVSNGETAGH